jgi:alpha-L-arabinofuranosidase
LILEGDFGAIEVAAALAEDGTVLTLSIVNPLASASVVEINLQGAQLTPEATRHWVAGAQAEAFNTPGLTRQVDEYHDTVSVGEDLTVPSLSATIFRIPLK